MKKPNYDDMQGKHPIPHAKDAIKDGVKVNQKSTKENKEKEEE